MGLSDAVRQGILWAGFGFLIYFFHTNIAELSFSAFQLSFLPLFISLVLICVAYLLNGVRISLMLRETSDMSLSDGMQMFFTYQISSYVPGLIWQFLHISYEGSSRGMERHAAAGATLLYEGITLTAAAILLGPLLFPGLPPAIVLLGGVLGASILLSPLLLRTALNHVPDAISSGPLQNPYTWTHLIGYYLLSTVSWVLAGAGFYFLSQGTIGAAAPLATSISGYAGAWAAGFLVFVLPGGLGVREGALTYFLTPYLGAGPAFTLAVAARLWSAVPQFLFGMLTIIRRRHSL